MQILSSEFGYDLNLALLSFLRKMKFKEKGKKQTRKEINMTKIKHKIQSVC